jgi:hypothetical protein
MAGIKVVGRRGDERGVVRCDGNVNSGDENGGKG